MVCEKLIAAKCTIERAFGMIEGISCGLDNAPAQTLLDAIEMIEGAVKVIEDGS